MEKLKIEEKDLVPIGRDMSFPNDGLFIDPSNGKRYLGIYKFGIIKKRTPRIFIDISGFVVET